MYAKDETGAYNLLPIKEQCGVKDPYVNQYGALVGNMRDYDYHDTCACVKNPRESIMLQSVLVTLPSIFRGHEGRCRGGCGLLAGGGDHEPHIRPAQHDDKDLAGQDRPTTP